MLLNGLKNHQKFMFATSGLFIKRFYFNILAFRRESSFIIQGNFDKAISQTILWNIFVEKLFVS